MQKISYINQMNGFMARCSEDALPANAVVMYLMLFNCFNRSCWRNTWMRFTIQQLMAFTHVGSPNTVYNMRRLLKELGYIDYRTVKNGARPQVEYRLIPLGMSSRSGSGMTAYCTFADIPCDNTECSANERSDNQYANSQRSVSGYAKTKHSNSEYSISEHSKNEYSNSENLNSECSISENCGREYAGECSGECSKSERQTDNSPNREEKEKKIYTSHDTSGMYGEEINKNINININNGKAMSEHTIAGTDTKQTGENPSENTASSPVTGIQAPDDNKNSAEKAASSPAPMSLSEFYRTNGDYLLCADAYREYFKREPQSEDRGRILHLLAAYGAENTLSAMDVMIRDNAASFSYCEEVLRYSPWKIHRNAVRRPAPRPSKEWEGWQMA